MGKGNVLKDWRDAIMIPLGKGKGTGVYVRITEALHFYRQLEIYWQAYLSQNAMPKEIMNTILLETRCGFRQNSNVTDMNFLIFLVQRLQNLFNIHCLVAHTKVLLVLIPDLLYTDHRDFVTHPKPF